MKPQYIVSLGKNNLFYSKDVAWVGVSREQATRLSLKDAKRIAQQLRQPRIGYNAEVGDRINHGTSKRQDRALRGEERRRRVDVAQLRESSEPQDPPGDRQEADPGGTVKLYVGFSDGTYSFLRVAV